MLKTFLEKPFFAPPSVKPTVSVFEKGVFIVAFDKGQELRGVLINDEVWVACFMNDKPFNDSDKKIEHHTLHRDGGRSESSRYQLKKEYRL